MREFTVTTQQRTECINITATIAQIVDREGITSALCHIHIPHTTAGIFINENADPAVVGDITQLFDRLIPWDGPYQHSEGNTAAHMKALMTGTSQSIVIQDGRMMLGVWQGIFFAEFDGPRQRTVQVSFHPPR